MLACDGALCAEARCAESVRAAAVVGVVVEGESSRACGRCLLRLGAVGEVPLNGAAQAVFECSVSVPAKHPFCTAGINTSARLAVRT